VTDAIDVDAEFVNDPHKVFHRLRTEAPVCRIVLEGGIRAWLVSRYADVQALLHDPRLIKDQIRAQAQFEPDRPRPYVASVDRNMLGLDPPEHSRLRKLVVKAFTSGAVERMRPRIESIADELLDSIERSGPVGPVDLVGHYAGPLPIRVISDLLGLPSRHARRFRDVCGPLISNATDTQKASSAHETSMILEEVIDYKRRVPGDDLLTALIQIGLDGDRLSHEELVAMCFLLTVAGYETTVNLIANGVLALLNNPDQLRTVRDDPGLIPSAIEEVLRFDGPINLATPRYTTVDITVGEVVIPRNEIVFVALLSANRDGDRFDDPDRFDVTRPAEGHVAFGHGIHHCLGAPLARMEGAIALGRLLGRYDDIALDSTEPLQFKDGTLMHGLTALPVLLRNNSQRPQGV
jgi:cytochrome P450